MTRFSAYMCLLFLLLLQCDKKQAHMSHESPYLTVEDKEIQELVSGMTLEEKLGQLLILETELHPSCTEDSIYTYVREQLISGVILSNLDAIQYMRIIDNCNAFSSKRFLHGTRENVSVSNQFSNTIPFPSYAALNTCSNDSLVQNVYDIYAQQLAAFNFDFAIGPNISLAGSDSGLLSQSFTSSVDRVTQEAKRFNRLLQSCETIGIANQLNQYVDIHADSLGNHPELKLLSTFSNMGPSGLMLGPDFFLDQDFSELPFEFLKYHLHKQYDYEGILIASVKNSNVRKLIQTGVDLILVSDVRKQATALNELYQEGIISDATLNEKVARILKMKNWIGDNKNGRKMDVEAANYLIHYEEYDFLVKSIQETSIAVTHNPQTLIPFTDLKDHKFVIHNLGKFDAGVFKATFKKFANAQIYQHYDHVNGVLDLASLVDEKGTTNIYLYNGSELNEKERTELKDKLNSQRKGNALIINFGDPRYLAPFSAHIASIHSYDNDQNAQFAAAQLAFGAYSSDAYLDLAVNEFIRPDLRYPIEKIRLKYSDPREVGIDPTELVGIDAIVNTAIRNQAIPGCQVLVAKSGKIIYSKGFGHQTYDKYLPINTENLYDIASVSKVAGTTLAAMKLVEENKMSFTDRMKNLLDLDKKSRIRNIYLRDLLLHRSNLQPNMPISDFVDTQDSLVRECTDKYCYNKTVAHSQAVAKDFYINKLHVDTLWDKVFSLKPYKKSKYRYSDVNFNLLHKVIEEKGEQKLDGFLYDKFYDRIGLRNLGYNPLKKHELTKIAPTEFDKKWRKQVVQGFVHDEAAALQGGVAGSAGLFSNAEDLAYLFQMLLNGGEYGGETFLKEETIDKFVTPPYYSRRGYGFDKPRGKYTESCSSKASKATYGHSGFTGTCVWVDPETDLIYIFLSNRIYPSVDNRKLFKDKYRGRIHTVIYNALESYKWKSPNPYQLNFEAKPIQS